MILVQLSKLFEMQRDTENIQSQIILQNVEYFEMLIKLIVIFNYSFSRYIIKTRNHLENLNMI